MARKIKFPLEMDNGIEVRSMEELRDNFSIVHVLIYLKNGKLVTWLRDRHQNDIADLLQELDVEEPEYVKCELPEKLTLVRS